MNILTPEESDKKFNEGYSKYDFEELLKVINYPKPDETQTITYCCYKYIITDYPRWKQINDKRILTEIVLRLNKAGWKASYKKCWFVDEYYIVIERK